MQNNPRATYSLPKLIAGLGLAALIVGLILMLLLPGIRYATWGILALGIILLAIAFILDFRRVRQAITGQRGRFSTGTTIMASVFLGITLLVNAISIGKYQRFDLTSLEQFTLTSQTKEAISNLKTPVQIIAFFTPDDPYGIANYATNLLKEYQNYSTQLTVKTIDPDEHPDQARKYGIAQYQTVVFESQNKRRFVLAQDITQEAEHAFTSAILEVTGTVQKRVYFLSGHGESNIFSTAANDYNAARQGLLDNLYQVGVLDLMITPSIPKDAAALIMAAPQKPLTSSETAIIKGYLENGGWVMILLNPHSPQEIRQLLTPWGIEIEDGTVIDPASYAAPSIDSPSIPKIRNVFGLATTYFPGAIGLVPQEKVAENIQRLVLAWTGENSWVERDFNPEKEPVFNEGQERKGPLPLGILVVAAPASATEETKENRGTRLVVFADSDFASNQHFYNGANGDLFVNAVNLLTAGTELISIERKVLPFRRLVVGPEIAQFINYSSIGLLPLLVLLTGGIIWWRRR